MEDKNVEVLVKEAYKKGKLDAYNHLADGIESEMKNREKISDIDKQCPRTVREVAEATILLIRSIAEGEEKNV